MSNAYEFGAYDKRIITALDKAGVAIDVVYDVGASNASWSGVVSDALGKGEFHMFEPINGAYLSVRKWVMDARPNLILHNIGLGSETAEAVCNVYESEFSSTFIATKTSLIKEKLSVPVWRLDDYCASKGLPAPDFIKMDVQGFELEILKGAEKTLSKTKAMLLETWAYRGYGPATPVLGEIIEWLSPRGFVAVGVGDLYFAPNNMLTAIDVVFLRKEIAESLPGDVAKVLQTPPT